MAYRLRYSDYSTTEGPPDPAEWVGPPGPPGPQGVPGPPGPMPPGGPFLPLSGGTVTGPLAINHAYPSAQTTASMQIARSNTTATFPPLISVQAGVGGSVTSSGGSPPAYFAYTVNNDGVDAAAVGGTAGLSTGIVTVAGATGTRVALNATVLVSQPAANPGTTYYLAGYLGASASANAGGTVSVPRGAVMGFNPLAELLNGATYYDGLTAAEFNINANAGSSVAYKTGFSLIQGSNSVVQGSIADIGFMMGNPIGAVGWKYGVSFGASWASWPIDPAGTIIGAMPSLMGGAAYACAWGIDFSNVAFSGGLIKGAGFSVTGTGHIQSGAGIDFGSQLSTGHADFSKHINLYGGQFGINISSDANTNYVASAAHYFWMGTTSVGYINSTGINMPVGQQGTNPGSFSTLSALGTVSGAGFTALLSTYALSSSVPVASSTTPVMNATAAVGTGTTWARADHVHPSDTSRLALAGGTMTGAVAYNAGGISFGSQLSTGPQDFSKHINLYGNQFGICIDNVGNTAYTASASHSFWMGTTNVGYINSSGLNMAVGQQGPTVGTFTTVTINASGPTIRSGTGAATGTQPKGSMWLRTDGAAGSTLYVTQGGGTWAAVAGV